MRKVIYLDTLILLNAFVSYIILLSVRQFCNVKTRPVRVVMASFVGGVASLTIFAPRMPLLLTVPFKLSVCALITFTAFFVRKGTKLLRCYCLMLLMTFCYGGVMMFLAYLLNGFVTYQNGVGYIGVDFWKIVLAVSGAYGLIVLFRRRWKSDKETFYYNIELINGEKNVKGTALLDSGHFVTDCYTGRPVVIVCESMLRQLLDEEALKDLKSFGALKEEQPETKMKPRCIPVQTVSGSMLLPAFTCEKIKIYNEGSYCAVNGVSLALTDQINELPCDALINRKLFEG